MMQPQEQKRMRRTLKGPGKLLAINKKHKISNHVHFYHFFHRFLTARFIFESKIAACFDHFHLFEFFTKFQKLDLFLSVICKAICNELSERRKFETSLILFSAYFHSLVAQREECTMFFVFHHHSLQPLKYSFTVVKRFCYQFSLKRMKIQCK
jgi:hypothetical protein